MTSSTKLAKFTRIAVGSLGAGAVLALVFMGAPADAAVHAKALYGTSI